MTEESAKTEEVPLSKIYGLFLPDLPVPPAVAVRLVLGGVILVTAPVWGVVIGVLLVVWLAYAIGKHAMDAVDKVLKK